MALLFSMIYQKQSQMKNFVNYKVLGLVELYNFDTKFVFIQVLMKKL
jgi:ABC-type transporter Mla MlaB component